MSLSATSPSTFTARRGLFVFTHDLRVCDNRALSALASQVDALDALYVLESSSVNYRSASRGALPTLYLDATLKQLDAALRPFGQRLVLEQGAWTETIVAYCLRHGVTHVGVSEAFGLDELKRQATLVKALQELNIALTTVDQHSLFEKHHWPVVPHPHQLSFSQFRRFIERANLNVKGVYTPTHLPAPMSESTANHSERSAAGTQSHSSSVWLAKAGCIEGKKHLADYFCSDLPQVYKQTRNAIDDWDSSTKLSPWLALGSLSVRQVLRELKHHEQCFGKNDSTQWIQVELLWREYFHWQMHHAGPEYFSASGVNRQPRASRQSTADFKQWSLGKTPYPIVNAIIRQLNQTGYISNRARQIAASCWVNEYQGDWRWGAAHYQQQLLDYDVAINWGNWQYIAGVGFDKKGGRHFNLGKQTQLFDPQGHYIQRWAPTSHQDFEQMGQTTTVPKRSVQPHSVESDSPQLGLPSSFG
ncbi:DASH family cryptochrome [Vibrio ulleungensis]|uniref:Cryptochrome DASH n=1 Tax=Vibrio ulleungensis TaxID=2807619 RepID=A0ABS2HFN2_9VIBR|nr:DASH family cryptochrome [Vibrio ulleungensis]MBM7034928.1 DASH family cryptochrome [Vibrio ulleungensis]